MRKSRLSFSADPYIPLSIFIMNDTELSQEQLQEELTVLRRQVAQLKHQNATFEAQSELISSLVTMSLTNSGTLMFKSVLLQIVKIATKLTGAEEASLFLLDNEHSITDSILARGAVVREQKRSLVGQVLDRGLAGWVCQHLKIAVIEDTEQDDRWFTLPNEPYIVRSALCAPILIGKNLLGVITLMHSQPGFFTPHTSQTLLAILDTMGVVLNHARLQKAEVDQQQESGTHHPVLSIPVSQSSSASVPVSASLDLSSLGMYIIGEDGNFLYANHQLATIFSYDFAQLVALKSLFAIVDKSKPTYHVLEEKIHQCLNGHIKEFTHQFQGQCQGGRLISVEISGSRTKFYGKSVIIGILRSVSG